MRPFPTRSLLLRAAVALLLPALGALSAQAPPKAKPGREAIISAARAMMTSHRYCALITMDKAGLPVVRTMNPLAPDPDMTIWFATHDQSRKAQQLLKDPRVVVYYSDHMKAEGYVALRGRATLVSDPAEIQKRKRAYWDQAFPGLKHLVLIKIVPERMEVLSYKDQLVVDQATGETPAVEFP